MPELPPPRKPGEWTEDDHSKALDAAALPILPFVAIAVCILLCALVHIVSVAASNAWFSQ